MTRTPRSPRIQNWLFPLFATAVAGVITASCAPVPPPAAKRPGAPSGLAKARPPASAPSSLQPQYAQFECRWADSPIEIDGKADEPAWKNAQVVDHFYLPWLGKDARLAKTATRAKLLWDREYVYFHADMDDPDVWNQVKENDGPIWTQDCFEIFFKPAKDKPGYYEFEFSPLNKILDMFIPVRSFGAWERFRDDGQFNITTAVQIRGTLNKWDDKDQGWSVEGKIPWKSFIRTGGRPEPGDVWSFCLCRVDANLGQEENELSVNAPLSGPKPNFHKHEDYSPIRFVGPKKEGQTALPEKLPPLTTSKVIGAPEPPPPYRVVPAYPNLKLPFPINIARVPDSDVMLAIVADKTYAPIRVVSFRDDPQVSSTDLQLSIDAVAWDFAFHPDFKNNGYVYIGMNAPFTKEPDRMDRIVRYTMTRRTPYTIDPNSATTIIEWKSDGHNGGAIDFGPDGMLYITSGDGTSDSDQWLSGQDLSRLLAKCLRIDVDHPDAGRNYSVPKDNPFVGRENVRPETWAFGFRNPWRMRFDPKQGHLWVTQNGQDQYEQVYFVRKGENYGWSAQEGSHPFYVDRNHTGIPITPPTVEHSHAEARSLTGGFVYYGNQLPELQGWYVYGDYSTGRIWAVKHDGQKVVGTRELAQTRLKITAFGTNNRGELLVLDHVKDCPIWKVVPAPPVAATANFPKKLSESGLFKSVKDHTMQDGILPYSVNAELWSDGAYKQRYMAIPASTPNDTGDGDRRITFNKNRGFDFPDGTVLVKSFALEQKAGDPASRKWIETRFFTKQQGEWAGYSYEWNDEGTDATLVENNGKDKDFKIADEKASEATRTQKWHYPSRTECMVCHARAANFVLGPSLLQMNKDHDYGNGHIENQLAVLERLGLMRTDWRGEVNGEIRAEGKKLGLTKEALDEYVQKQTATIEKTPKTASAFLPKPPGEYQKLVNPYDESQDLEARARSYLQSNCAICHIEAGGGNAAMELGFTTPRKDMKLIDTRPLHNNFGIEGAKLVAPGDPAKSVLLHRLTVRGTGQMPPLSTYVVDQRAVELMRKWIEQLKPESAALK